MLSKEQLVEFPSENTLNDVFNSVGSMFPESETQYLKFFIEELFRKGYILKKISDNHPVLSISDTCQHEFSGVHVLTSGNWLNCYKCSFWKKVN